MREVCNCEHTLNRYIAGIEDAVLRVENVAVVGNNTGNNGNAGLYSEMESALLKGKQRRLLGVATSAFREHVDTLSLGLDFVGGTGHGLAGVLAVGAVDKDTPAQTHEPTQKGDKLEGALSGDTAVLGEQGS